MDKLLKYKMHILISILLIAGVLFALIGNSFKVQAGGACLSWGLAVLVMLLFNRQKQLEETNNFDIQANEILQDIAIKGANSEYYQFYNIDIVAKLRKKIIKKHNKQTISCAIFGAVLIITAIICMV